jgi:hypothetical protein
MHTFCTMKQVLTAPVYISAPLNWAPGKRRQVTVATFQNRPGHCETLGKIEASAVLTNKRRSYRLTISGTDGFVIHRAEQVQAY